MKAAELIVPIPELEDGSPDWRVVQQVEIILFPFLQKMTNDQVWWDMEDVVARFESEDKYPVDLAVEDRSTAARKTNFSKLPEIGERISPGFAFLPPRFMAGSEMLLAANHGNKYSIAIEVNTRLPFLPLPARFTPGGQFTPCRSRSVGGVQGGHRRQLGQLQVPKMSLNIFQVR